MLNTLVNFFMGCTHKRTTFPISSRPAKGLRKPDSTYVVCLDCGQEFPYSWEEMRLLPDKPKQPSTVAEQVRSFSVTK